MVEKVFDDIYRIELPLPKNPLKFNSHLIKEQIGIFLSIPDSIVGMQEALLQPLQN